MLRLMGLWGCGYRGSDIHQIHRSVGPPERMRAEPAPLGMDVAELDIGIAHQPVATFGFADANRFADQRLADKDQLTGPFDLAVAAHPADRDIAAIARLVNPLRVGPRRGLVDRSRRLLSQRLVRSLVVVNRTKLLEALLLRRQAVGGRRGGLLLERAMHPLVPPVLLRLAGNDPLGPDAQLDPPHRQPRQTAHPGRGKRRTVVRTDRPWQPMLLERRLEDRPYVLFIGPRHRLTAQQIAAVRITQEPAPAKAGVNGSQRRPSPVRNQPLKSVHHTSLAAATAANGRV